MVKKTCAREAVPRASGNKIRTLDEWRQLVAGADAQQLLLLKMMDVDKIAPKLATYIGPMHLFLTPFGRFVRLAEHYKTCFVFCLNNFAARPLPSCSQLSFAGLGCTSENSPWFKRQAQFSTNMSVAPAACVLFTPRFIHSLIR